MVATIQSGVTAMNHYILCETCFTNDSIDSIHTMGLWMHRVRNCLLKYIKIYKYIYNNCIFLISMLKYKYG